MQTCCGRNGDAQKSLDQYTTYGIRVGSGSFEFFDSTVVKREFLMNHCPENIWRELEYQASSRQLLHDIHGLHRAFLL